MKEVEILLLPIPLEIWRELLWWMLNMPPDCTADLEFADRSPYLSAQIQDPNYKDLMNYGEWMFYWFYSNKESIYDGLDPCPWFEFGTLAERGNWSSIWSVQQDCTTSSTRPIKTGNRLATEEDRQRARPHTWVMPHILYGRVLLEKGLPYNL